MKIYFRTRNYTTAVAVVLLLYTFLYANFENNLIFKKAYKQDRIFCMILTHLKNLQGKVN
jgi:hypothetical protein